MSATKAMTPAEAVAAAGDERNAAGQSVALHVDGDGSRLTAERWQCRVSITLSIDNGSLVDVDALDIPAITTAMYRACGQEPPVMLGRPEVDLNGSTRVGDLHVWKEQSGCVGFMAADPDVAARTGALRLEPHMVRQLAAVAIAYADAPPQPDPAEVDALACLVMEVLNPGAMGIAGARPLARKILLAGWKREAGNG